MEQRCPAGGRRTVRARPLLFTGPAREHPRLDGALRELAKALTEELGRLARAADQRALADWCRGAAFEEHRLDFAVELAKGPVRLRLLVVTLPAFGGRLGFFPALAAPFFFLRAGEAVDARAGELLKVWLRAREKSGEEDAELWPESLSLTGKAWVDSLELSLAPARVWEPPGDRLGALLGAEARLDGAEELNRTGRCLDRLYPEGLERARFREAELGELSAALAAPDRRPALVLAPRGAGKTALIHEAVFRAREGGKRDFERGLFWQLAPSRLVSGMSYVGQWERRLLAIVDHAAEKDHVLYFDDLVGLFSAGISSDAELSMGQALKPHLERRRVRVLGEITPEGWRVLRERDRGFADLFEVVRLNPMPEEEVWRLLIRLQRELEERHACRFGPDAPAAALELARRFGGGVAMPGRAVELLKRLGARRAGSEEEIGRDDAVADFRSLTGLRGFAFDARSVMTRETLLESLGRRVVGQPEALAALADAALLVKAGLSDPGRPAASFLFLGPTGVGKTQCAKALAALLFEDEGRLLRLDMNEYATPYAAARLVGTFAHPEGTLTAAVRQNPFCVLLLDEIEKADPEVLDLLLQVLGEGRLTDARGRTADFTNAFIVMTSNLGAREAGRALGFGARPGAEGKSYREAAERFFRPELFNRIDRVVPFRAVGREDMRRVAAIAVGEVFAREGFARRRCALRIEPAALERVVEEGYHPLLGARAIKRAVESRLTAPAARRLAELPPGEPALVRIGPGPDGVVVAVDRLENASPPAGSLAALDWSDPGALLARAEAAAPRLAAELDAAAPAGAIGAEHYHFFALRDRARRLARRLAGLARAGGPAGAAGVALRHGGRKPAVPRRRESRLLELRRPDWRALTEGEAWAPAPAESALPRSERELMTELLRELAYLRAATAGGGARERALVRLFAMGLEARVEARGRRELYRELFQVRLDLEAQPLESADDEEHALLVEGPGALAFARAEAGVTLVLPNFGSLELWVASVEPLGPGEYAAAALAAARARRGRWLAELAAGRAALADDPLRVGPVIRVLGEDNATVDLRSGLARRGELSAEDMAAFVLSALPLPEELR